MRRLLLSATILVGALGPWPAFAQQNCQMGVDHLGQRIAALEAAGATSIKPSAEEIAQLRALRQTGERLSQAGNVRACETVLSEAGSMVRSVEQPRVVSADDLEDMALRGVDGADMGKISELVIDPNTGRIAYAVVDAGGFLGLGERHFPVPWAVLQPAEGGNGFVLNVTKDRLTAAPQFTRDNRPDMSDRQWSVALHTYYGVQPYWMRDSAALAATGMPAGGGSAPPQLQQEVQRLSQEVERLNRELSQARTLADTNAPKPAEPGAGASGNAPSPSQGGSAAPTTNQ